MSWVQVIPGEPYVDEKLKDVLLQLKRIGGKVTGSYATGRATSNSDLDIQIPDDPEGRRWKQARAILMATGWKLESSLPMHLGTRESSTMLEVSCLFNPIPRKERMPEVEIAGIVFKTH